MQGNEEWMGQKSHKWTTTRKHVIPPNYYKENIKEKIFSGNAFSNI